MQTTAIKMKRRKQRQRRLTALAIMAVAALLALAYLLMSLYFKNHFFFRTEVNGLKVGGKTTAEAEEKMEAAMCRTALWRGLLRNRICSPGFRPCSGRIRSMSQRP